MRDVAAGRLQVLVPSRSRPESVARMVSAFLDTGAYEHADLVYIVDADDPRHGEYFQQSLPEGPIAECSRVRPPWGPLVQFQTMDTWKPLVPKLNEVALAAAESGVRYLAFLGDDHVPRTPGWAKEFKWVLGGWGTHIVYGDDTIQHERIPTHWAMTGHLVRALGGMVPAPVQHLYCDNAVKALGDAASCIRYLPQVTIEHVHPVAGKTEWDDQYRRVNRPEQYERDAALYGQWRNGPGFKSALAKALALDLID